MTINYLELNIKCLALAGLSPKQSNKFFIFYSPMLVLACCVFTGQFIKYFHCQNYNLGCVLDNTLYFTLSVMTLLLPILLFFKKKAILDLIVMLENMEEAYSTTEESKLAEKYIKIIVKGSVFYIGAGVVQYITVPLLTYDACVKSNNSRISKSCGLPFPIYVPYDISENPAYATTLLLINIFISIGSTAVVHVLMVAVSCVIHIKAHFDVLKKTLRGVCEVEKNGRVEVLKRCVRHHNDILQ